MENQEQPKGYQKKPLPEERPRATHHITTVEWGLVIGTLITVDLIQILLDIFVVGVAVNRFIDGFVGGSLMLYTKIRCKNIAFGKTIMRTVITFIGEEIPVVDALPLWTLDGFYLMGLERAGEKASQVVAKVPGAKLAATAYMVKKSADLKKGKKDEGGQKGDDKKKDPKKTDGSSTSERKDDSSEKSPENIRKEKREASLMELATHIAIQGGGKQKPKETSRERLDQYKKEHADEGFDENTTDEEFKKAA